MNILLDIMGLIARGRVKPPEDTDYLVVASYMETKEVLKPQPKMQANLISVGALKKLIQPSTYKTYTALVTQTGNFQSLNKLNGFTIGEKYFIFYLAPGDDFSNVGFLQLNSLFIATGTTATTWTSSGVIIYDEDVLPVLVVLDNSLGITLTPEFNGINNSTSSFKLVSNLPLFLENKTIFTPYGWGDNNNIAQAKGVFRLDNSTLILGQISPLGSFKPFPIEIRVNES